MQEAQTLSKYVLAIDLGTDLLPALALGTEKPEADVMQRPPRKRGQPLVGRSLALRAFAWLGLLEAFFCFLGFFWVYDGGRTLMNLAAQIGWHLTLPALPPLGHAQIYLLATTVYHAGVVFSQAGNAIACRSEKSHFRQLGWLSNPLLIGAIGLELVLILWIVYFPPLARIFSHYPLPPYLWIGLGLFAPGVYGFERLRKMLFHRHKQGGSKSKQEALL